MEPVYVGVFDKGDLVDLQAPRGGKCKMIEAELDLVIVHTGDVVTLVKETRVDSKSTFEPFGFSYRKTATGWTKERG